GALEFSDKMAAAGIQPIVGCALAIDFSDQEALQPAGRAAPPAPPRVALLAARENGYRSLMRLNSRAFLETAPSEPPHLRLSWLEGETEGLIALTGGARAAPACGISRRHGEPRCAICRRAGPPGADPLRGARAAVRRSALHRAAAPWQPRGTQRRAGAHRARLRARDPARRHQRATVCNPGRLRGRL